MTVHIDGVWGAILFLVMFMPALICGLGVFYGLKKWMQHWLRFGAKAKPYRRWKQRRRVAREERWARPGA